MFFFLNFDWRKDGKRCGDKSDWLWRENCRPQVGHLKWIKRLGIWIGYRKRAYFASTWSKITTAYLYIYVWYLVEKLKGVERNMIMSLFFHYLNCQFAKRYRFWPLIICIYMKLSYGVKEKDDAILSETHYEGMFLHKYVNMKHNPILVSFTYSTPLNEYVISFHIW